MSENKSIEEEFQEFSNDVNLNWKALLKVIPLKIKAILTTSYDKPLTTEIKHPTNINCIETLESKSDNIIRSLEIKFPDNPPFTIVRLIEVLKDPTLYYLHPEKFLRALENVTCVTTTASLTGREANGNGSSVKVIPEDFENFLPTEISWLTDEDRKELESEFYLADEYPLNDVSFTEYEENETELEHEVEDGNEVEEHDGDKSEDYAIDQSPEPKKRKSTDQDEEFDISTESPEKRYKTLDTKKESISNGKVKQDEEKGNSEAENENVLPKEDEHEQEQEENKELKYSDKEIKSDDIDTEQDADVTLEEDKMDID